MNKLRKLFYSSWLGNVYFEFLLWLDRKQERKITKEMLNTPRIVINRQQELYTQGIKKIKKAINQKISFTSKEEYDKVLKETEDLIQFAQNEEERQYIEALKNAYVYKDKDIKNDTDMAKMIEIRIGHYNELKRHKERREKARAERRSKQDRTKV